MSMWSWWTGKPDKPLRTPEEIEAAAARLRADMKAEAEAEYKRDHWHEYDRCKRCDAEYHHPDARCDEAVLCPPCRRAMHAVMDRFDEFRLPEYWLCSLWLHAQDAPANFLDEQYAHQLSMSYVARQCHAAPMDAIRRPSDTWHCCHNTLDLQALCGSLAPTILVNHDCEVTGDAGHSKVYRQVGVAK